MKVRCGENFRKAPETAGHSLTYHCGITELFRRNGEEKEVDSGHWADELGVEGSSKGFYFEVTPVAASSGSGFLEVLIV
jgi:hypothetical protein